MKFLSTSFQTLSCPYLWKNSIGGVAESVVTETIESPMQKFASEVGTDIVSSASEEVTEDVQDVLENNIGANRLRRFWNKTKYFFKTKVLGVIEKKRENQEDVEDSVKLENRSTGEIKAKYLYKTDDVYMFSACVEKLINRSDFVLRDPKLLKTINRIAQQEVFESNDHKELSNEAFNKKFSDWVRSVPELGPQKADLWTENFVAENMKKSDEDYKSYTDKAVENKEEFVETITSYFADFRNQENLSSIDKGYVLAFLRKAISGEKLSKNLAIQLLIHGAAIGLITNSDLQKIKEDFDPKSPLFNNIESVEFADFKKWSAAINGGHIPKTKEEFSKENDGALDTIFSNTIEADNLPIEG